MSTSDLKRAGLKVTLPRMQILEILEHSDPRHLSAEDIYRALIDSGSDIGLATVYRVLTQFETAGLVLRHRFDGNQSVFELSAGGNHNHIVCIKTGHVEEFTDALIEERLNKIATELGYEISDYTLTVYGEYTKVK